MVVFDEHTVGERKPVVGSSTERHSPFLDGPPAGEGLACVEDCDRVTAHGLAESTRERRNPREVLEEIQGDSLGREDRSAVSFDAQERLAGCCTGAVFLHHRQGERCINGEKGLNGGRHSCDNEVLLRNDPAFSGYPIGKEGRRRDVASSRVFFQRLPNSASDLGGRQDGYVQAPSRVRSCCSLLASSV